MLFYVATVKKCYFDIESSFLIGLTYLNLPKKSIKYYQWLSTLISPNCNHLSKNNFLWCAKCLKNHMFLIASDNYGIAMQLPNLITKNVIHESLLFEMAWKIASHWGGDRLTRYFSSMYQKLKRLRLSPEIPFFLVQLSVIIFPTKVFIPSAVIKRFYRWRIERLAVSIKCVPTSKRLLVFSRRQFKLIAAVGQQVVT